MAAHRAALLVALLVGGGLLTGCLSASESEADATAAPTDTIEPKSAADSVAYRLLQAHGADAWVSARYLRFNFGIEGPEGAQVVARHLWDRSTGQYRVEWSSGPDSTYVALIDIRGVVDSRPKGSAYLNGSELTDEVGRKVREQAYSRFVNDTYWLLAPLKTFDPGVRRSYLPDSSTAEHEVLHLSFGDVGLTPGDQYWMYVSEETGRLDRWAFHLQGMDEETPPQPFDWTEYVELQAPEGSVHLATRKEAVGQDQVILTNNLSLPDAPPEGAFSTPEPILGSDE